MQSAWAKQKPEIQKELEQEGLRRAQRGRKAAAYKVFEQEDEELAERQVTGPPRRAEP